MVAVVLPANDFSTSKFHSMYFGFLKLLTMEKSTGGENGTGASAALILVRVPPLATALRNAVLLAAACAHTLLGAPEAIHILLLDAEGVIVNVPTLGAAV